MTHKKIKVDGFRLSKEFVETGKFTDARVYKERGKIHIIVVKDGKLYIGLSKSYSAFKDFKVEEDICAMIDEFIKEEVYS